MENPGIKKSLVAMVVGQLLTSGSQAATLTVNSNSDTVEDNELCTLREAVDSINSGALVEDACGGTNFGTEDEITFDSGLNNESIILTSGELLISQPVSIDASNLDQFTIDADKLSRVMNINIAVVDSEVSLNSLTIQNGLTNAVSGNSGGGVKLNGDVSLEMKNCTLLDNTATFGGGISSSSSGLVIVSDSIFTGNRGLGGGGAAMNISSTALQLRIERSQLSDNNATFDGGAITTRTQTTIEDSTISNNSSGRSGAGIAASKSLTITSSTLSANSTNGVGGAIASLSSAQNPMLINSTVSGNFSLNGAGTFHTYSATSFNLQNSTLVDNVSSSTPFSNAVDVGLFNTIFSGVGGVVDCGEFNSIYATAQTIIEGGACGTSASTTLTGLLPLSDNGGFTQTHALEGNSTAVNSGDSSICPNQDQRGEPRDSQCDIGSFEAPPVESSFFVVPTSNGKSVIFGL